MNLSYYIRAIAESPTKKYCGSRNLPAFAITIITLIEQIYLFTNRGVAWNLHIRPAYLLCATFLADVSGMTMKVK
jgi:hypothetical protein